MAGRVEGKTVLIIGGGSPKDGLNNGKAAALLYGREGAQLAIADRDTEAAERTCAAVRAEGGEAIALTADVTDSACLAHACSATHAAYGRIDIVHNNVGIAETGGPVETSQESWDRVIAVNQTGIFLVCKHAIPFMLDQGGGAIVNISSAAALRWIGFPYAAYTASKAAVLALTQNIALQYAGQGIRANCVLPGLMDTPMIREPLAARYGGEIDTMIARRNAQSPTGNMGDAWDTAYAALFLASDEARYVTGTQIVVDGGLTQRCA
ncbi:NAD(P)-dependent dehydrogenase (short-subunit alcohol dehydrogenase family) [Breoghania corrubedonensis]|uniref:NAD(P)-dependent dehydrogenase (Short-subunit alcohol dehydrogenase family) n=1 Tax=Breoghania corrubedonensis TaxID=665038 RepID=A0A2T5VC90_9HYPH|nr:SDR family NAD(P)-dependent oxidoreductase [Breoghania corrubedonensis]PTW61370.1 NAD(P)-dependent dehydrogenase (short-subunit alcohol dehydrogenase family) [Breoghania corrubedonensis]